MGSTNTAVLIVGAGPTGLTLAIELALHGVPFRIVDREAARPAVESRALGTFARSQEIFERIGALDRMYYEGTPIEGFQFHWNGKMLTRVSLHGANSSYPLGFMINQAETERHLIERLAELGHQVERFRTLDAFTDHGDRIACNIVDAKGKTEIVDAVYLAACDGGRSGIRRQLGLSFDGLKMQGEYLIDCDVEWRNGRFPPYGVGQSFLSTTSMIAMVPLPRGSWRVIVSFKDQDDPRMKPEGPTLEVMQKLLDEIPGLDVTLSNVTWASSFYIANRRVEQLRHGRVFLMGDAAHIHSPVGGQGMNTGIADASNLGWKLAHVLKGAAPDKLLDSYDAERMPVIKDLLTGTGIGEKVLLTRNPFFARVRNVVILVGVKLGAMQKQFQTLLSGYRSYPDSPLNLDAYDADPGFGSIFGGIPKFSKGPKPGMLAPDVHGLTLSGEHRWRRLNELFALNPAKHHLLIFGGPFVSPERYAELQQEVIRIRETSGDWIEPYVISVPIISGKGMLFDRMSDAHIAYGARRECLYFIRPDGYISLRSRPVDFALLLKYLQRHYPGMSGVEAE
ncbi:MAG: FAD-dependent monooxygenase [Sphingomonadaceae bacterium]|nr:FAD-dependent monooxygenase [Sphingomonadaceae bacterium]